MNNITKKQIQGFILDFLRKRNSEFSIKGKQFTCPICKEQSANIFPPNSNKVHCFTPECGNLGDIFDLCRKIDFDDNPDIPNNDIAEFLINEFSIKTNDNLEKLLAQYSAWGWDLVPVEPGGKASNRESNWQNKSHKDINEWKQWINNGLNIGVKGGELSNTLIVDLDLVPSKLKKKIYEGKGTKEDILEAIKIKTEKLEHIKSLGIFDFDTVIQDTFGGAHLFYKNDKEIKKCAFDYEDIHVDIQSAGGQAVIEPSIVGGYSRKIIGTDIKPISKKLKEYIIKHTQTKITKNEEITDDIQSDKVNTEGIIKGLDGICNQRFIEVGGMFRKIMNVRQTEQALKLVNQHMLDDPMKLKDIKQMCKQIDNYHKADINAISLEILNHMKLVTEANVRDLKECLGYDRSDLEQALRYLCDNKKLYKIKKDLYKFVENVIWRTDFMNISKPLNFKVPYFGNIANFNNGSMIVIGAKTGQGKSHTAMNIVKDLITQGIKPRLISTESDSGVGEIAMRLNLKEGDFEFITTSDPTTVPFSDNEVRIIDWLKAPNSEFFKLDSIYQQLSNQLTNHGGLMIIFAQLKKENDQFYAENMVEQFASLVAKFLYPKKGEVIDNANPYFKTTKIRRSKNNQQYITIPLTYNNETKILRKK